VTKRIGVLHDTIHDHSLDLLAITETWVPDSAPDSINLDLAPAGFTVLYVHRRSTWVGTGRPGGADSRRGGGVALVYRANLSLKLVPAHDLIIRDLPKTTYELLLARLLCPHGTVLVGGIYRPPSSSVSTFVSEFACLLDRLTSVNNEHSSMWRLKHFIRRRFIFWPPSRSNYKWSRTHSACQVPHPHQRKYVGLDFHQHGWNRCRRRTCCGRGRGWSLTHIVISCCLAVQETIQTRRLSLLDIDDFAVRFGSRLSGMRDETISCNPDLFCAALQTCLLSTLDEMVLVQIVTRTRPTPGHFLQVMLVQRKCWSDGGVKQW